MLQAFVCYVSSKNVKRLQFGKCLLLLYTYYSPRETQLSQKTQVKPKNKLDYDLK